MKFYIYLLVPLFLTISSCKEDVKEINPAEKSTKSVVKKVFNLNISLLLDLSDRIDTIKYSNKAMQYYLRDVGYIESVANSFIEHMSHKKVREIDDKIALYFNPEPKDPRINTLSGNLKFHPTRKTVSPKLFDSIKENYFTKPQEIYELAIADGKYVGSDTWSFFKNKVKDYCIDDSYRNILVILTDGYMYHKDNLKKEANLTTYLTPRDIRNFKLNTSTWNNRFANEEYGFIPAEENLGNLEILVLGINPDKKNPYEEEVIMKYWSDWFNKMGVEKFDIKTAVLPADMNKIIKSFILNE